MIRPGARFQLALVAVVALLLAYLLFAAAVDAAQTGALVIPKGRNSPARAILKSDGDLLFSCLVVLEFLAACGFLLAALYSLRILMGAARNPTDRAALQRFDEALNRRTATRFHPAWLLVLAALVVAAVVAMDRLH